VSGENPTQEPSLIWCSSRKYLEEKLKLKMNGEKSKVASVAAVRNFMFQIMGSLLPDSSVKPYGRTYPFAVPPFAEQDPFSCRKNRFLIILVLLLVLICVDSYGVAF